jgi:hypothetical protein
MDTINTYNQLGHAKELGLVPIAISKNYGPLSDHTSGVTVWHLTEKTDPKAAWYDYGCLTFLFFNLSAPDLSGSFHQRLQAVTNQAKAWVKEKYSVTEWERNRMGDWVPAPLNTKFPLRKR